MLHPGGGSSYALSYRIQKIIESLDSDNKPDCLLVGHFHKAFTLPAYRGVAAVAAGCTQRQTGVLDGQIVFSSTWRGFAPSKQEIPILE